MVSYVRLRSLPDAEIARLYAEGLDSDSVGARARCSGGTVLTIARAAGVPIRQPGGRRRWTLDIPKDAVISRYLDGQSGPTIAAAAGCTPSAIYHVLRAAGVQRRPSAVALRAAASRRRGRKAGGDG